MQSNAFERWLPISFRFNSSTCSVGWMDFGSKSLLDPFFDHTVASLRSSSPPAPERFTTVEELVQLADSFPPIDPAGVIFHVSRCGSTLLVNTMKAGGECTVLSEAPMIDSLIRQRSFNGISVGVAGDDNKRQRLLQAVVSLYTACFGQQVLIKAHTSHILHVSRMRSAWPSVPFILNVRNPVEVMASNLAMPADWVRSILAPYGHENVFGFTGPETRRMSIEEYCARGLSKFFEAANAQMDSKCYVLDYSQMTIDNIYTAANLLGVKMPSTSERQIRSAFSTYSKDPEGKMEHKDDRDWKQRDSPDSVHSLAAQWAMEPYQRLLKAPTVLTSLPNGTTQPSCSTAVPTM
jgi:hypothetical protein